MPQIKQRTIILLVVQNYKRSKVETTTNLSKIRTIVNLLVLYHWYFIVSSNDRTIRSSVTTRISMALTRTDQV